jgi:DNA-binding PucR family transcriptional regulator
LGALGGDRATEDAQLATRRDHRSVFLLPAAVDLADVDAVCAERYLRGSAVARRPITEVSASYRLAADGLGAAPEHAFDDRAVLDEGDNQLLALLTARPYADTNAVVAAVLGTLTEPAHNHLLAGLSAFIATGTATEAAAALHVHPQTLRYRLRRAREVTGRDPRRAWHRLALDTALQLRQLQRPT